MAEKKPARPQISFEIDDETRRQFRTKAVARGESTAGLLNAFVNSYLRGEIADPPVVDCPICGSTLKVDGQAVYIIQAASEQETIKIPPNLRGEVEEFLNFAISPIISDVEWRDMMLDLFRKRAAKRKSVQK